MKRLTKIFLLFIVILTLGACSTDSSSTDSNDQLIIGIDDAFAPMGFRDENNNIVGFDIDLAKAVGEQMDTKVVFQPIDWGSKETELQSGRIDLIWNGYTVTEERKQKVLFTEPYLANAQVIVTLKDSEINSLNDLAGKSVGLQAQSSASNALNNSEIASEIKDITEFKTNVLALQDLDNGRIDAVVIDEVVIDYYMTLKPDTYKVLEESLAPELYAVGVKKGNNELLEKVQKAMDEIIKNGTAAEISEKWFGENKILN
ncbi:amino acid ABC transporter substrate-binding protein [Caldibacillus thermolactis]|jgi:polar amino acid transport system substrate-binding protein|uniref:Amino acid ABC transporter substrate-binding protein n=1 Tax=Pallidibacillus thermolactis TaxID=251051 RepID=A0ABT2WCR1_9BACI|nr:amino acid ABC transporter substrate-binding protein [Pallidibacillus thermolactis]MCU9593470.1 amino acid ABC transporter substrate-binding protein [Pallidibacillus thermolactis]MCU9601412.1 amino acid ABC transporter substrate-binding protein [Pallidibacillus thermolactis subsp. kokeshiiformis]